MLEVLTYGHEILREKAEPVKQVNDAVRRLAKDLLATMYRANGVGLATQQIGRREAMFVIDVSPRAGPEEARQPPENPGVPMPLVLINPAITELKAEQRAEEGCLSFPEVYVTLTRAAEVVVAFTDLDGRERTARATGLLARVIQHEMDHLNGVLLVDRMSLAQKIAVAGKLKRLKQRASAAG